MISSPRNLIAHIISEEPKCTESLAEHLVSVKARAEQFGAKIGCTVLEGVIAQIHDFGKAAIEVQKYLWSVGDTSEEDTEHSTKTHGPDHSSAGAQFLKKHLPGLGILLAYAIAGHHTGMPDHCRV